jgi:hypothetical protein
MITLGKNIMNFMIKLMENLLNNILPVYVFLVEEVETSIGASCCY